MKTASYLKFKLQQHEIKGADDIDPKFFNVVAQIAHFGAMYTVTNIFSVVSGRFLHHRWAGLILGIVACVSYATWHEFFWDPTHENAATRGSGLEDFIFLVLGSVVAALVYSFPIA
jgi:VanZ family protein